MPERKRGASPGAPQLAQDAELGFQREIFREFESGSAQCFILYFNIYDFVFAPGLKGPGYVPLRLRDYLGQLFRQRGFDVVLYYSLSGGLTYLDEERMRPLVERAVPHAPQQPRRGPREYGQSGPEDTIPALSESQVALSYLYRLLTYGEGGKDAPRTAVILEYLESMAPCENAPHGPDAAFNIQLLHRLGLARQLRRRHLVVGLTADLGHVASSLYAAESEWRTCRVDLPIEEMQGRTGGHPLRHDRRDWIEFIVGQALPVSQLPNPLAAGGSKGTLDSAEALAGQTSGFNYDNLRDLIFYAAKTGEPVTIEAVRRRKRTIITVESRELLEIVEPRDGFGIISGYGHVKKRLWAIRDAIAKQATDLWAAQVVPKGILFLGPPGTGKSLVASALAEETGFNMVKLRNIRGRYVGQTESNLNRVLDLLSAMHPVIVFVDEIDGAFVGRDGIDTSGGVEQRIFQRILEFMAMDENRGRVLWIAASNRPDRIDAALLSRFDMIIPFLLPDDEARRDMLVKSFPGRNSYTFDPEPAASFEKAVTLTRGFSGRELDTISRRAMQLATEEHLASAAPLAGAPASDLPVVSVAHLLQALGEFRRARDQATYDLQTLLAIQATNFYPFLPGREELPEAIRSQEGSAYPVDEDRLRDEIMRLQKLLHELR